MDALANSVLVVGDPSRTSLTCVDGRMLDLLNPRPEDISLSVIVEHLAKANRYCGATSCLTYSVAEHSARCANAAMRATGNSILAGYMLCHDMHEAYLGDDTTPKKRALAAIIESFGALASTVDRAFAALTERLDIVIHQRAGLAWPPDDLHRRAIKHFDRVLLATEWRDVMRCDPPYDFGVEPLPETIVPLERWRDAGIMLSTACAHILPQGFAIPPRRQPTTVRLGPESFTPAVPDSEIVEIARAAAVLGEERS